MHLVMTNIAEGDEIFRRVFPSFRIRIEMMSFKMPRIGGIPFFVIPPTIPAFVFVSLKDLTAHLVGNYPVVLGCLSCAC